MKRIAPLLVVLATAGCAGEGGPELDPAIELGFHRGGSYEVLREGGTCWVADAIQGGYWTMPAVRTQGLSDEGSVMCVLEDDQVGELGRETRHRFFDEADGEDGTLEIKQFLVPLLAVDDPMYAELPGRTGRITCSVRDDDGVEIEAVISVVFDTEVSGPLED